MMKYLRFYFNFLFNQNAFRFRVNVFTMLTISELTLGERYFFLFLLKCAHLYFKLIAKNTLFNYVLNLYLNNYTRYRHYYRL